MFTYIFALTTDGVTITHKVHSISDGWAWGHIANYIRNNDLHPQTVQLITTVIYN